MASTALELPEGGRPIFRREKIEAYVRNVRRKASGSRAAALGAAAELESYGGSHGPFRLVSRVIENGTVWFSRVEARREATAAQVAAMLATVLGREGWQIERDGAAWIITKPLEGA